MSKSVAIKKSSNPVTGSLGDDAAHSCSRASEECFQMLPESRVQINSLNIFRALAIVFIVARHCYWAAGITFDTFPEFVVWHMLAGGSILFVFISGYFFHHVYYKDFNYGSFLKRRLPRLAVPYLVLGMLPILVRVYFNIDTHDGFFVANGDNLWERWVVPVLKYLATGRFIVAYWYIPFALALFSLAPFHVWYIRQKRVLKFFILGVFMVYPLVVQRQLNQIFNVVHLVMYYTPAYLAGILVSVERERLNALMKGREYLFLVPVVSLVVLSALQDVDGHLRGIPRGFETLEIAYVQKVFLSLFLVCWLQRFETWKHWFVLMVARASFAIFFLHAFLVQIPLRGFPLLGLAISEQWYSWPLYLLLVFLSVAIPAVFANRFKEKYPSAARYLLGM